MEIIPATPNKCLLYLFSNEKYDKLDTPLINVENLTWYTVSEIIPYDTYHIFMLKGGDKYITALSYKTHLHNDKEIFVAIVIIKSITADDIQIIEKINEQVLKCIRALEP